MTSPRPGLLYVWGRNSDGQCSVGPATPAPGPPNTVALPHAVASLGCNVLSVACGTGQQSAGRANSCQGCTIAVLQDGSVWSFGNNSGGRLGHDGEPQRHAHAHPSASKPPPSSTPGASRSKQPSRPPLSNSSAAQVQSSPVPRRIEGLRSVHVTQVSCSDAHALACSRDGSLFSWGKQNNSNCLGRPQVPPAARAAPDRIHFFDATHPVRSCDCECGYSAAVTRDGSLYTWGSNTLGRLGVGDASDRSSPTRVPLGAAARVVSVSLGTLFDKICTQLRCMRVLHLVIAVACTRGQEGVKGGLHPKEGGTEGPHTLCVAASGFMYSFGLLGNLADKTGAFGQPWDELFPYRIGSAPRNTCKVPPLSPYACWPPETYALEPGRITSVVSAHIHAAACGDDGRLWAWGCGSNDGRCGVERFLNMAGESRPPRVDAMKCYMMGPHRVGCARAQYWPHSPSLDGVRVLAVASGRNHMACIGVDGGAAASFVNRGLALGPTD